MNPTIAGIINVVMANIKHTAAIIPNVKIIGTIDFRIANMGSPKADLLSSINTYSLDILWAFEKNNAKKRTAAMSKIYMTQQYQSVHDLS